MLKRLLEWDRDTFVYLNNLGIEQYDAFWSFVTSITTWIPLFIIFIFLFFYKTPWRVGVLRTSTLLGLVIFIITVTDLTKNYVARLRPNNEEQINTLIRILKSPTDYSFFSGHAASSFSITLLVYLIVRKKYRWTVIFFIWPLLFASSRIFVGVHYPLDIITGIVVGLLSGLLFYFIYKTIKSKLNWTLKHSTHG